MTTLLHLALVLLPFLTAILGTRWVTQWVGDLPHDPSRTAPRSHPTWTDGNLPSQRYADLDLR